MEKVTVDDLKKLYIPPRESHKGENGKLTIIGGSHLFHGASLWALKVASRIVDMVFYASVAENNELTQKLKGEIYDFIAVPREEMESYIEESDCVLIGPGMVRSTRPPIPPPPEECFAHLGGVPLAATEVSLGWILALKDEGEQTYYLTKYLLQKFPQKKWVIDAGSLQMMEPEWLNKNCLITPHRGEFEKLFGEKADIEQMAKKYNCTILLKGETDIICGLGRVEDRLRPDVASGLRRVDGGNSGMTKGGTGDVLAGLVAALACKNDLFLAACAGSLINKKAGEELFKKAGYYFNASDLCDQIPIFMGELVKKLINSRE